MSDQLVQLTATKLAELIRARAVSPVEVMEAYLAWIEKVNPSLNAIVTLAPDALDRAREAEAALMRGETSGALVGVPVTIKDTIETKDCERPAGLSCAPVMFRQWMLRRSPACAPPAP